MTRVVHITLSVWLAVLLVFGGTPKEFIHLFADHHDTTHCNQLHSDGLVMESQHHHCTFLSFTLAPFLNDGQVIHLFFQKTTYPRQTAAVVQHLTSREVITALLRGPPVLC